MCIISIIWMSPAPRMPAGKCRLIARDPLQKSSIMVLAGILGQMPSREQANLTLRKERPLQKCLRLWICFQKGTNLDLWICQDKLLKILGCFHHTSSHNTIYIYNMAVSQPGGFSPSPVYRGNGCTHAADVSNQS